MANYDYEASERFLAQNRHTMMLIVFTVPLLIVLARLFELQVVESDYYYTISEKNRLRIMPQPAGRGLLLDRNGIVLVDNQPTYTISIMPYEFPADSTHVRELANFLSVPETLIWSHYNRTSQIKHMPVKIKHRVDFETVSQLTEQSWRFPGVIYQIEPVRKYNFGKIAPHIFGYVGEVNAAELAAREQEGLKPGDMVGKLGLERYFDALLRGSDGAKFLEVKSNGEVVGELRDHPEIIPRNGAKLTLTIDARLQKKLEELSTVVTKGALIAVDPRNGDILAAVSRPDFDPSIFTQAKNDSIWRVLNDRVNFPMLTRWYQGLYPPASPLKIMSAAAAVDENIANAYTKMAEPCHGYYKYGDRYFFCWLRTGHKDLDMLGAIAHSCDVYFYQIGAMLGLDRWSEYAKASRFGQKTGVTLLHESAGLVPDRAYYNERFGRRNWGAGVVLNLVIGQGEMLVTPLQMAMFVAAFANGGTLYKPRLVKSVEVPGKFRREFLPEQNGMLPFSRQAIQTVNRGMVLCVNDPWATGFGSSLSDITVAGKTGTAQNPHGEDHAWFVAFAPAEKPEIAFVVLVEGGGSGGAWSWISRAFLDYYFHEYKFHTQ